MYFMHTSLFCGVFGYPTIDDDVFVASNSELEPSVPAENNVDDTELLGGLGFPEDAGEDSASSLLSPSGFDSGGNLFDTDLRGSLSLSEIAMAQGEANVDGGSNFDLLDLTANSPLGCESDQERPIDGIGRRGTTCSDPLLLQEPSTDVQQPLDNPDGLFPPPGSNPGREPGEMNDPKPRPSGVTSVANSDFDFQYCPSGLGGYRLYAVCDSGFESDRQLIGGSYYALYRCTRRK